jgi:hypothetical protein
VLKANSPQQMSIFKVNPDNYASKETEQTFAERRAKPRQVAQRQNVSRHAKERMGIYYEEQKRAEVQKTQATFGMEKG